MKRFKFSLRLKIALAFLLLVVVMISTAGYIFTIRELNLRVEQVKERMERLARNIATIRSVETEDWEVYQNYIDNQIKVNPDIVYIAIFDDKGDLKVHSLNTDWLDLDNTRTLSYFEQANIVLRLDQRQVAKESQKDIESKSVNIIVGDRNLGTVNIGFSLVELNDEMRRNLYRNLQLDLLFIILAMGISLLVSSRIVNPLGKLTRAMEQIARGHLDQELSVRSHDEIGEMTRTFNFMTRGLQQKQVIENFSRELAYSIDLHKTVRLIAEQITQAANAQQSHLFLQDSANANHFNLMISYPTPHNEAVPIHKDQQFFQFLLKHEAPFLLDDLISQFENFDLLRKLCAMDESVFLWSFIIKDKLIGFLLLSPYKGQQYSTAEINFLRTLIGQSSFAIENALLYQELTEQERLKRELEIARKVQMSLLPQDNPHLAGLEIDGICIPAMETGGDYYDYFHIDDRTLGVVVADVTGKGTSAAFYMAMIKGMMVSLASIYTSPRQFLCELNRRSYGLMDRKIFVTMIYAIIDVPKKLVRFARAGHQSLLLLDADANHVECFTPRGIGIGLAHDSLFQQHITEQEIQLNRGAALILYTDGITETMNLRFEEFGDQRFIELLKAQRNKSAAEIRSTIISAVNEFAEGAPQHDDITLVAVRAV